MPEDYHRYDISDEAWTLIEPLLPGRKGTWGGNARDNRLFINAVFWILRTGAPWRDLPPDYGSWNNVNRRFCRWRDRGVWEKILEAIIDRPEYEWLIVEESRTESHSERIAGVCVCGAARGEPLPLDGYILPWMRMICRSDYLSRQLPVKVAGRLAGLWKRQARGGSVSQ